MSLLHLAPDLQEEILFLQPTPRGYTPIAPLGRSPTMPTSLLLNWIARGNHSTFFEQLISTRATTTLARMTAGTTIADVR